MKLFKDYAVLAGGQVASKVATFLAFAWLARVLDPEGYGVVEYIVGLSVFFAALVDGGFGVIGVRRSAGRPFALPDLTIQIRAARAILTVIGVPLMVLVAFSATKSTVSAGLVWLFALSLLLAPLRHEWLFQATERMADVSIAQLIRTGMFALLVWVLVTSPFDLNAVGWAELGALAATTAYCMYVQHSIVGPARIRGSMQAFAPLMREGAVVGIGNVASAMTQYAPLFLIATMMGGVQTAWFAAASRVIGSLLIFSYVYHFSLYPAVSRATARKDGNLARLLAESCRVTAWGSIFAAMALTLLAEPLIVLTMGENMRSGAPMVRVMAWMLPMVICSGHARWALAAVGAQTRVLWAQVAGLIATVSVALLLYPWAQALAFAVAALAGLLMVWVVSHVLAARSSLQPPPFRLALKPALLAAAIVLASRYLGSGFWVPIAGFVLFISAAPLLDRKLLAAISLLGSAKLDFDSARGN